MGLILSLIESTCKFFFGLLTLIVLYSILSSPDRLLVFLFGASGLAGTARGTASKVRSPDAYHGMLGVMIMSLRL